MIRFRLTFGLVVLKNFRLRPWEGCLTVIMGVFFFLILGVTVIWNLFFPGVSFNNAYDEVKGQGSSENQRTRFRVEKNESVTLHYVRISAQSLVVTYRNATLRGPCVYPRNIPEKI